MRQGIKTSAVLVSALFTIIASCSRFKYIQFPVGERNGLSPITAFELTPKQVGVPQHKVGQVQCCLISQGSSVDAWGNCE